LPDTISEERMPTSNFRSTLVGLGVFVLAAVVIYHLDPTFFGLMPGNSINSIDSFQGTMGSDSGSSESPTQNKNAGSKDKNAVEDNENNANKPSKKGSDVSGEMFSGSISGFVDAVKKMGDEEEEGSEGFANMEDITGPAAFDSAGSPAGCYPRDQLTPGELLPKDPNSVWAQQNPMGTGSLKGKNFLSAGALIGVNTVGQSLRNANYQLRSEPANPQVPVSVFNVSTIEPDTNRRDFEVTG
jgi:hypothetical protein